MKTAFLILVFLHGIIHILGFLKAFRLAEVAQLSRTIPKSLGILWLLCTILFLTVFLLMIFNRSWWPFFAVAAVILSQSLIIIFWHDAKFATILNVVILLVSIPALGQYHFEKMVQKEQKQLIANITEKIPEAISEGDLVNLPEIVQKWMMDSGVIGKPEIISVCLKQKGEMKIKQDGNWMPFYAEQFFDVKNPAFNWKVEVKPFPGIHLAGRDKFKDGEGEMQIKLLSLFNVVDDGKNEKVNSGTMLRFLGEICWFPSAALNRYITWEEIDATSAKATFRLNDKSVSGLFIFNENGELKSFEAERFYGAGQDAKKEKWLIETISHKEFDGVKVPAECNVTWKLPEGDFTWLKLELTEVDYNKPHLFKKGS
ncbi:MAG: DUF6544 family protein [Gillisia sp.]